ncbi:hypothetical protein [Novipirellula sp.]|uniref:hypothetical protein n=1 Tax=Novipirellula sp. TaxID=2795430 RepID=UPI003565F9B8
MLTFFLFAALDNLTTTIVMVALLRKLINDRKDRWRFVGMVFAIGLVVAKRLRKWTNDE